MDHVKENYSKIFFYTSMTLKDGARLILDAYDSGNIQELKIMYDTLSNWKWYVYNIYIHTRNKL